MARPTQPGLTENELEIMQVLWQMAPLKVGEILERITRRPKPAYTSLMTLVQIMDRKGYVRHEQEGKAFVYYPVLEKRNFLAQELRRLSRRLFNGNVMSLVTSLVADEHLSQSEIEELKQILEAR